LTNTTEIIPVTAGSNAIDRQATHGPVFGTTDLVVFDPATTGGCSSTLTPAYVHASPAVALAGRVAPWGALDVEVLQVLPPSSDKVTSAPSVTINWDQTDNLRRGARAWVPTSGNIVQIERPHVLLVGGMGTGKSATINTIITSLSEVDGIRRIATARSEGKSVTTKLGGYDLGLLGPNGQALANFVLLDAPGWTQKNYSKTVDHLLDGKIPHDNSVSIGETDNHRIDEKLLLSLNSFADQVHCVVFVFPYDKTKSDTDIANYFPLIEPAFDEVIARGITYLAVITFIDEDPDVQALGLKAAYSSPSIAASRSRVAGLTKLSKGEVLLVKNYNEEAQPTAEVNGLALFLVRTIQQSVDNFLDRFALGFGGKVAINKKK